MLKTVMREITLAIQARSGASIAVLIWLAIMAVALLAAFVFLCVAAYDWLVPRYGTVIAGLIMTAIFVAVAAISAIAAAVVRRRVRQRAILARAAKAQAPPWLLDPRVLGVAMQAGRSLGWERIVPVAILGFLAAQWARERRDKSQKNF
jgi:MFS family permease